MGPKRRAGRLDLLAIAGVPVSVALILVGQMLEGGRAHTLFQATAALIVTPTAAHAGASVVLVEGAGGLRVPVAGESPPDD